MFAAHLEAMSAVSNSKRIQTTLKLLNSDGGVFGNKKAEQNILDEMLGRIRTDLLASGKLRHLSTFDI